MSIASSVAKIGEVFAIWLDPERKEKVVLRRAVEAAEELLKILRKQDPYDKMPVNKVFDLERHYQKQFNSWKDGTP